MNGDASRASKGRVNNISIEYEKGKKGYSQNRFSVMPITKHTHIQLTVVGEIYCVD